MNLAYALGDDVDHRSLIQETLTLPAGWMDQEIVWMQTRDLASTSAVPAGFPFAFPKFDLLDRVTTQGPRTISPKVPLAGGVHDLTGAALWCQSDIGAQFFHDALIELHRNGALSNTPGKFFTE